MGVEREVHGVRVAAVTEVNSAQYDALVLVTSPGVAPPQALEDFVADARQLDAGLDAGTHVLRCARVSGARLVLAGTGALSPYDDVRAVREAARAGLLRAAAAGSCRPVLVLQPHPRWPDADLVALLAALEVLYVVSLFALSVSHSPCDPSTYVTYCSRCRSASRSRRRRTGCARWACTGRVCRRRSTGCCATPPRSRSPGDTRTPFYHS